MKATCASLNKPACGAALLLGAALLIGTTSCGGREGRGLFGRDSFAGKDPVTGLRDRAAELERSATARNGMNGMTDEEWAEAARQGIPEPTGPEEIPADAAPVPELPNVHFEFDSDELTASAERVLDQNAGYLRGREELQVLLRGHTDERGTAEYNVALGSRRAITVRDAMAERGIDPGRIRTVSFGREVPLVEGEDEASHSQNRRVEFFVYTLEED